MDAAIVSSFANILKAFAPCFTAPSMDTFTMLMAGWVLNLRRHTITEIVRAAGAVGCKHISSFHRFFSQASWLMDEVGLTLAELIIKRLAPAGVIRLVVDDTLGRHTGKQIAAASMHRDPLLSTGRRASFSWGHVWVVLAIEVTLFGKSRALPVLFRLHRSEKRCKKEKRAYSKITDQARELVELLASKYPQRQFQVLGDSAYTNSTLIKNRRSNVHLIGRGRLDAALYAPAPSGVRARRVDRGFGANISHHRPNKRKPRTLLGRRSRSTSTAKRLRYSCWSSMLCGTSPLAAS